VKNLSRLARLASNDEGFADIKQIIEAAPAHLSPSGALWLETVSRILTD
jgi:methylase of polypeptide subunit release factors